MSGATFDVVPRGKLRRLARHGRDVDIALYACQVTRPPHVKHGKTYMELDLSAAAGDVDTLRAACDAIQTTAKPAFTPVHGSRAVVKLLKTTVYETAEGSAGTRFVPDTGDLVDVILTPGAFGAFGYCVLVKRIKPHALKHPQTKHPQTQP